jgi:hypothetical protein
MNGPQAFLPVATNVSKRVPYRGFTGANTRALNQSSSLRMDV